MAHDPLCPVGSEMCGDCGEYVAGCACDLITAVRADNDREWLNNRGKSMVYAAALRDAVEAVVNCDDYHGKANMLLVDAYREGLQAAREAIEALVDTSQQRGIEHINLGGYDPQASDNRP